MAERLDQLDRLDESDLGADADAPPPIDPAAVHRSYQRHRVARRVRHERARASKRAGRRFWVTLVLLLAVSLALVVLAWRDIESLFGL